MTGSAPGSGAVGGERRAPVKASSRGTPASLSRAWDRQTPRTRGRGRAVGGTTHAGGLSSGLRQRQFSQQGSTCAPDDSRRESAQTRPVSHRPHSGLGNVFYGRRVPHYRGSDFGKTCTPAPPLQRKNHNLQTGHPSPSLRRQDRNRGRQAHRNDGKAD